MTSLPTTRDLPNRQHGALFVQNLGQDRLFTRSSMDAAAEKLRAVCAALGRPERYQHRVYDAPHQFDVEMQEEAFAWLEKWLRR